MNRFSENGWAKEKKEKKQLEAVVSRIFQIKKLKFRYEIMHKQLVVSRSLNAMQIKRRSCSCTADKDQELTTKKNNY